MNLKNILFRHHLFLENKGKLKIFQNANAIIVTITNSTSYHIIQNQIPSKTTKKKKPNKSNPRRPIYFPSNQTTTLPKGNNQCHKFGLVSLFCAEKIVLDKEEGSNHVFNLKSHVL